MVVLFVVVVLCSVGAFYYFGERTRQNIAKQDLAHIEVTFRSLRRFLIGSLFLLACGVLFFEESLSVLLGLVLVACVLYVITAVQWLQVAVLRLRAV